MYTFRLTFGGLCAFVPGGRGGAVDVVFLNTRAVPVDKLSYRHEPHFPTLSCRVADLRSDTGGGRGAGGTGGRAQRRRGRRRRGGDVRVVAQARAAPDRHAPRAGRRGLHGGTAPPAPA